MAGELPELEGAIGSMTLIDHGASAYHSRFGPKEVVGLNLPTPAFGSHLRDPFFEQPGVTLISPSDGLYRQTYFPLDTTNEDAGMSLILPTSGAYRNTLIDLDPAEDDAGMALLLPAQGIYRETYVPLDPAEDDAGLSLITPTSGAYLLS